MLYYDDARHAYLYTVEPPPNVLDVLHPVDVVSNSMVDTFVFGLGIGRTMSYGTQVGEIWFEDAEHHVVNWRARGGAGTRRDPVGGQRPQRDRQKGRGQHAGSFRRPHSQRYR